MSFVLPDNAKIPAMELIRLSKVPELIHSWASTEVKNLIPSLIV